MNLKEPIFFGMNILQLVTALIVGLIVGLIMIGSSIPKVSDVPVQVITPVPTPPPVVVTQTPVQDVWLNQTLSSILADNMMMPFTLIWYWMFPVVVMFMIWTVIKFLRDYHDDY